MTSPKWPTLLVGALLGVGAVTSACAGESSPGDSSARQAEGTTADLATVEYDVSGMTCGGCALATETAVGRLDGVAEVEASYQDGDGYARVSYDPARIDPARIAAAIEELGYHPVARPGF